MAEAMFKNLLELNQLKTEASSAGISATAGMAPSPETISFLEKKGLDVSHHRAKRLTLGMIREADLIFVMQKNHLEKIASKMPEAVHKTFLFSDFHPEFKNEEIGIPDPMGMGELFYENVGLLIETCCQQILTRLEETLNFESKSVPSQLDESHQ